MGSLRIAACQINTVVGDVAGNVERMAAALDQAESAGAQLAVFPELAITGYPPEDLLLKEGFVADNHLALGEVARLTRSCAAVVGFVDGHRPGSLYNAAALCRDGLVQDVYHKRVLPNYSVFDEQRYFIPGRGQLEVYAVAGVAIGISVCEDVWSESGPIATLGELGAQVIVNLNASPYCAGRVAERQSLLQLRGAQARCPLVYVNQVGGQDELVFDGASMVVGANGALLARAAQFEEDVMVFDLDLDLDPGPGPGPALAPVIKETFHGPEEIYRALVLGTRDYVHKNGFTDVVIGVSGGIDSSLVAAVACDGLGSEHVHGVAMPSRYSSPGSELDAALLASNLSMSLTTVPIDAGHRAFEAMLTGAVGANASLAGLGGLTEENLQSRLRGVLLMALSNEHGWMVLTTGNKSEMATGYSTLYGDSAGGFAVIKDVPKTLVYELCRDRNAREGTDIIPQSVLDKAPSAELRPDQRDDQTLPPYEVLDPVLSAYVEGDMTEAALVELGFSPPLVAQVAGLVDGAEYKRRQNPPGVRVSTKAFGKDRRMPITNRYRTYEGRRSHSPTPTDPPPRSDSQDGSPIP
ncbi:MAG: NAD+ synthase [Acidimicrobiales bacterium]